MRTLENPREGSQKCKKSRGRGVENTLEIQGEGVIKRQKSRGGRSHKIIEIPRKFLGGGASKFDDSRECGK